MGREDITDWLIHFTKDIYKKDVIDVFEGMLSDNCEQNELSLDYTNQLPDGFENLTAFEVLKRIIQECGIRYGYSFRNGQTTLYGGDPVICFTEMPINSLIEYSKQRQSNANSTYGIAIRKKDAFKYGARPVIYGLSPNNVFKYKKFDKTKRVLEETVLPLEEQYRYVHLDLNESRDVDWTHEREWRIKRRNDINHHTYVNHNYFLEEIKNLNIFEENGHCEEIIIIVNNDAEANEIFDMSLNLIDGYGNEYAISFQPKSLSILVINNLKNEKIPIKRIEDIRSEAFFKVELPVLTDNELNDIKKIILKCKDMISKSATEEYLDTHKLHPDFNDFVDTCGYATIKSYEVRSKNIRGLLKLGLASSFGNCYNIDAIGTHFLSQSISFHEYVAKKVCDALNNELENIFYVQSYID